MKRLLFLALAVIMTASLMAESVNVYLVNGQTIKGELLSYDEYILSIEPNTFVKYERKFRPNEVKYFEIEGVGRCNSTNGRFIFDESTRIIKVEETPVPEVQPQKVQPSSPNEVIGKAFKTCGGVAIGIGVPALAAGTILTIAGHVMPTGLNASKIATKARCCEAGCYLMPIGASLTIIGIPLMVQGKRVAELNFNYTGNGTGVSVEF
jgi:hypothetical protein